MLSEIVSIGTEILMGEIVDTNSGYLASKLPEMDIEVKAISVIGDDLESLSKTLIRALDQSDIIITTGGLGPTSDDLTREAISEVLKENMTIDKPMLAHLKKVFKRFKYFHEPSTPLSLQSRSLSGGESERINSLAVSAPYFSIIDKGSIIFFLDLDIFSERPSSTLYLSLT